MRTLYLLGNGFDLEHDINTPYSAFRTFLETYYEDFLIRFESMYHIQPLDDSEPWFSNEAQEKWNKRVLDDFWYRFEEKIGHPDIEGMMSMAQSLVDTMPENGIMDTLDYHWQNEYGFSSQLQKYLLEWIKSIDIPNTPCRKASLINAQNDVFINFNYTDTLEVIYGIKNVFHIHGSASSASIIPPIMGHGNIALINKYQDLYFSAYEAGCEWKASIFSAILKYCKSLFKDTESIISFNNEFFCSLNNVNHVISIGLSWGKVDIPYLIRIADAIHPSAKWTIYYHKDKSRLEEIFNSLGITAKFQVEFIQSDFFWD